MESKPRKKTGKSKASSRSLAVKWDGKNEPLDSIESRPAILVKIPDVAQDQNIPSKVKTSHDMLFWKFQDSQPLAGLAAFKSMMDFGFYPPIWVLKWLYRIFSKYTEAKGNLPLEELFGFRSDYQGASTIFEAKEISGQNSIVCLYIASLIGLGKKPGEAIRLVGDKICLDAGTIRNIYYRTKKKYFVALKKIESNMRRASPSDQKEFLEVFFKPSHK